MLPTRRGLDGSWTAADHYRLGRLRDDRTELSALGQRVSSLEQRLEYAEKVNAGLEEAALTTARALQEISSHWDGVYEAMRRKNAAETSADDP